MIRKHIKIYEDFEKPEIKELTSETAGSWSDVRDTIQNQDPFTIINFKNKRGYSKFINDTNHEYIKQNHSSFNEYEHRVTPSIFIKSNINIDSDDFGKYTLISVLNGKKDNENVHIQTENAEDDTIVGNEIVDSLERSDIGPDEHYKIGQVYYKFINFLS